jgi:hypothetical protein
VGRKRSHYVYWGQATQNISLPTQVRLQTTYPLDFINHRAPKMVFFFGIQLKSFQSHALQSSSRFSARREASESAKQIKFGKVKVDL